MTSMDYCKYENGCEYLDQILDEPEPASDGEKQAKEFLIQKMKRYIRENG